MKIVKEFVEVIFWVSIFLSPFITAMLFSFCLLADGYNLMSYLLMGIGALSGIIFAESVRKRYGCSNYISQLFHHK